MGGHVIEQLEMMDVHFEIIVLIDVYRNIYRLTRLRRTRLRCLHDNIDLCNRRRMHRCGEILAGHGTATGPGVVAAGPLDQRHSIRNHGAGRRDLEPLARWRVALSPAWLSTRVGIGSGRLHLLDFRLLLVASLSPRVAISLADPAPDSPLGASARNPDEFLQTPGRDLAEFHYQHSDCLHALRLRRSDRWLLHAAHRGPRILLSLEYQNAAMDRLRFPAAGIASRPSPVPSSHEQLRGPADLGHVVWDFQKSGALPRPLRLRRLAGGSLRRHARVSGCSPAA